MSDEYDTHDHDMTNADAMTPDELYDTDQDAELHQDAIDEDRFAAED